MRTDFSGANLSGCYVHGASVWSIKVNEHTIQKDLIITDRYESSITTDDIQMAQFIYLILTNKNLRTVIDTITSKAVL